MEFVEWVELVELMEFVPKRLQQRLLIRTSNVKKNRRKKKLFCFSVKTKMFNLMFLLYQTNTDFLAIEAIQIERFSGTQAFTVSGPLDIKSIQGLQHLSVP